MLAVVDFVAGTLFADRYFHRFPRESAYLRRSETLGFSPVPNSSIVHRDPELPDGGIELRRNGQGLRRDEDVAVPKPAGTTRILVIGDSHTDGMTANADTYPAQLESQLHERQRRSIEVLNGGVGRYSPWQSYLLLAEQQRQLRPDAVVVAIYAGNDLLDMLRSDDRPHLAIVDDHVVEQAPEFVVFAEGPLHFWRQRSLTYRFYREYADFLLERALLNVELVRDLGGSWGAAGEFLLAFQRCGDRSLLSQALLQTLYFDRFPGAAATAERLLGHVIDLHVALAQRDAYRLLFVLIPSRLPVEGPVQRARVDAAAAAFGYTGDAAAAEDRLLTRLGALLRDKQVPVVDARDALRAATSTEHPLYWRFDDHLDVRGCAVVAGVLAEALTRQFGWPP